MAQYTSVSYAVDEMSVTNLPANYGSGTDNHMPIGWSSSVNWRWRGLVKFFCGNNYLPAGSRLVSAILKMKTTDQTYHQSKGTNVKLRIGRITSAFDSSIGSGETWQSSGGTTGFLPLSDTIIYAAEGQHSHGTVYTYDITSIVEKIGPANVYKTGGVNFCNNYTNHGISIRCDDEGASADKTEFWSSKGGYDIRVVFTYEIEDPPSAATNITPSGTLSAAPASATFQTPSGDTANRYRMTIGEDTGGGVMLIPAWWDSYTEDAGYTSFTPGGTTTRSDVTGWVAGKNALVRVTTLNSSGDTATADSSFYITPKPVVTVDHTAGDLLKINNLGEAVQWTGTGDEAAVNVSAYYTHPTGVASAYMEVDVGGSTEVINPAIASHGTSINLITTRKMPRNTAENVRVRAYSQGVWSDWSSYVSLKCNWGQGVWRVANAAGAGSLSTVHGSNTGGGNSEVKYLYAPGGTTNWETDLSNVAPDGTNGVDVLVRMSTDNAANAPSLTSFGIEYDTAGDSVPDHWQTANATAILDSNSRRFGVHSALVTTTAAYGRIEAAQTVRVSKDTDYTMSCYVKIDGSLGNYVQMGYYNADYSQYVYGHTTQSTARTADTSASPEGWQRLYFSFNSGNDEYIRPFVNCPLSGASWRIDSFQLEEGDIATQWKPGGLGAVVLDAGGIAIDAAQGGTFRMLSSNENVFVLGDETITNTRDRATGEDNRQFGMFWRGAWSSSDSYIRDDVVSHSGAVYVCIKASTNHTPPNATYWVEVMEANYVPPTASPYIWEYTTTGSPHTWTKPSNLAFLKVEVLGGGGGGGGADDTASTEGASAGGGGGGGYAMKWFAESELPSTCTATTGSGGSVGANTGGTGGTGGTSTFTGTGITTVQGTGGGGGTGDAGGTGRAIFAGGSVGQGSGGDFNLDGEPGWHGDRVSLSGVAAATGLASGRGGGVANGLGFSGRWDGTGDAYEGTGYGAGGTGSYNHNNGSQHQGGGGRPGVVIVTEYYK